MPAPSDDAFVTGSADPIAALASLYDRFAYALDPFSKERDEAERVFMQDVANWGTTAWKNQNQVFTNFVKGLSKGVNPI